MVICFNRHSQTHAAQAQDGHKEEGAENSESHGVITPPRGAFCNLENSVHASLCASIVLRIVLEELLMNDK